MRSVTEQGALDEFLATAELAGTDFTAERTSNVKIIHTDVKNPYLLSSVEEKATLKKHDDNKSRLTVPRRPHWDASTTPNQLDMLERDAFLKWRRGLAQLQENQDLLMTPFERNIEVWRQLWRVIERSDLVVQIVDARNPLMFRSADLEAYVKDVDPRKENLLLINKADMMTYSQRMAWAEHLKRAKIAYKFFSASLANDINESRQFDDSEEEGSDEEAAGQSDGGAKMDAVAAGHERIAPVQEIQRGSSSENTSEEEGVEEEEDDVEDDEDTRILTVEELESLFLQHAPSNPGKCARYCIYQLEIC
jgi:large subunit GTPase 1